MHLQETVTLGNDTIIPIERYVRMLGTAIALSMHKLNSLPTQINQRRAWREFGRARVERWVAEDRITPIRTGGTVMYATEELVALANDVQDYLHQQS